MSATPPKIDPLNIEDDVRAFLTFLNRASTPGQTNNDGSCSKFILTSLEPTTSDDVHGVLASFSLSRTSRHVLPDTSSLTSLESAWIASKSALFDKDLRVPYVNTGDRDSFDIDLEKGLETATLTRNVWEETLADIFEEAYDVYKAAIAADADYEIGEKTGLLSRGLKSKYASIVQCGKGGMKSQDRLMGVVNRHTGDSPDATDIVATYKIQKGGRQGNTKVMEMDIMFKMEKE